MTRQTDTGRHDPRRPEEGAGRLLDRKVALARATLLFERLWRAMLWPFVVVGLFLIVSLGGLWELLPPTGHSVLLLLFAVAALVSLAPLLRVRLPDREAALRRLESGSGIEHRPASSYEDRLPPTAGHAERTLWAAHQRRLAALFARLRPGLPHPRLDRADPYALRAALLLLLAVMLVSAGPQARDRLAAAFQFSPPGGLIAHYRLDAWVTPPLYTAKPSVVLADGDADQSITSLAVPEKSLLVVRLNADSSASSTLRVTPRRGDATTMEPASYEAGLAEYRMTLTESGTVEVLVGSASVATWAFDLVEDTAPVIALSEEPVAGPRGSLRFGYRTQDDYGVAHAEARFALAEPNAEDSGERTAALAPPVIPLNLPRANAKIAESKIYKDLTAHPWAGLKVAMTLIATDQAGQKGVSEPHELVLPARRFTKPLAKAIVEQRRNLVRDPDARADVAQSLAALTIGAEHFIDDHVVYLGLRSVFWRLKNRRAGDAVTSSVEQLWDLALRVEDGDLPEAQAALRAVQEKLRRALEEGAPEEEIKRLIQELRAALQSYLRALAQRAERHGNVSQLPEGLGPQQMLSSKDLEDMLRTIENLARSGARELAQRMLNELQGLLERLQMGAMNPNSRSQQMMKMVQGLGEVITRQQQLLDETYKRQRQGQGQGEGRQGREQQGQLGRDGAPGRPGQPGQDGSGQPGQQAQPGQPGAGQSGRRFGDLIGRQGDIRGKLDSLLEQLRSFGARPPEPLEGAGRAMREAEKALQEQNLDRATQQQSLALDRLRQGTQSLAEQVLQSLASPMGRGNQGRKDPFGRPERTQGPDLGASVKVPDEIEIQRAREILEELRRRLSEPTRPMLELDYLERLIRQF